MCYYLNVHFQGQRVNKLATNSIINIETVIKTHFLTFLVNLIGPPINHTIKSEVCFILPFTIKTLKRPLLYRPPNYSIFSVLLILYFCKVQLFSIQFSEMAHSRSQIGEVRTDLKTKCLKNKFIFRSPKAATWFIYFSPCTLSPTVRQSLHYIIVSQ